MAIEKKDLVLQYEVSNYVKDGVKMNVKNYYVEVKSGDLTIKIQLKPIDYTGRSILSGYYE